MSSAQLARREANKRTDELVESLRSENAYLRAQLTAQTNIAQYLAQNLLASRTTSLPYQQQQLQSYQQQASQQTGLSHAEKLAAQYLGRF